MLRKPSERKSVKLAVCVNPVEKRYLEACAKKAGKCLGIYMREVSLEKKLKNEPTLPPEVLAFKAQLHHLCGLLQPFHQKRLDGEELSALDRAEIKQIVQSVADLARQLKTHLI